MPSCLLKRRGMFQVRQKLADERKNHRSSLTLLPWLALPLTAFQLTGSRLTGLLTASKPPQRRLKFTVSLTARWCALIEPTGSSST